MGWDFELRVILSKVGSLAAELERLKTCGMRQMRAVGELGYVPDGRAGSSPPGVPGQLVRDRRRPSVVDQIKLAAFAPAMRLNR